MSLFGTMKTSVSGMNAQANRLGTVSDNIANSGTTGYKRAETTFSTLMLSSGGGNYNSGAVQTSTSRSISQQGALSYTTSETDLAISGEGFFVVSDKSGSFLLSRDGTFQENRDGELVNSSGAKLLGYPYTNGEPTTVVNSFDGLEPVKTQGGGMTAAQSTRGVFSVNLPANAETVGSHIANVPPSANSPFSAYSHFIQLNDESPDLGGAVTNIYYTKTADDTWEITAFADWEGSGATFPYDLSNDDISMRTTTLKFDPVTGDLLSGDPILSFEPEDPSVLDFSALTESADGLGSTPKSYQSWNLPSDVPEIDTASGELPASANTDESTYTTKTTLNGYLGYSGSSSLDVYLTKTGPYTWDVAAYNTADSTAGGFPYGLSGSAPLASTTFEFDPSTGAMTSAGLLEIPLMSGDTYPIDFSGSVSLPDGTAGWVDTSSVSLNFNPAEPVVEKQIVGATTPAQNLATSTFTNKSSLTTYDTLGNRIQLDIYYTKGKDSTWEMAVFNHADASSSGFPYGADGSSPLVTKILTFNSDTGALEGEEQLEIPFGSGAPLTLSLDGTTQLAANFVVAAANVNGSGASPAIGYEISDDGILSMRYADGSLLPTYRIPLAAVESPDNLTVSGGNAFSANGSSGVTTLGFPGSSGFGSITSGALETSNVDLASELTEMIESQRSYSANSKVFQTGSELLNMLVELR
ncbi:flagellar hook-basal body complex protein [Rhizobium sp. CFBP 8752]|uniref:flagellar hook-basal body complex protein n=1 Tax=Rhizobium sp. CFBP 8752 TaxID=2775301 RepID=UPI00177F93F7|nr:flagellar hook-basal body complex protein [Rhizobium sp. CFBP 8752]MBD8665900.1 flagellar hook-basal body complex protein [Rhizobium sp. CFBP 8752]